MTEPPHHQVNLFQRMRSYGWLGAAACAFGLSAFPVVAAAPSVTTQPPSIITTNSATLNATINPNSFATTYWFEWGTNKGYANFTTTNSLIAVTFNFAVSASLANLKSNTTYHFRAVATSSQGTATGFDQAFTTPLPPPVATTVGASAIAMTSAKLNGSVNPNGAATTAYFEYGLTTGYGSVSSSTNAGSGTGYVFPGIIVTNLLSGTNYHFRMVASSSFGVGDGDDLSFTTLSGIPSVATLDTTDGDATTLRLNGAANPNGATTTAWFEWGATTSYGNASAAQSLGAGASPVNFSQVLTGLVPGTTYHYRAVAMSSFATNYGADILFSPVFGDIIAGLPGLREASVAWGDYDYDGRMDILLTGKTNVVLSGSVSQVWRNTGSGFGNIDAGLPGVSWGSVAWGDYDNDGRLDILLTGDTGSGYISQVWRNTGSGFSKASSPLPGVQYSSVAWGDFDNDGRLDILLTGDTGFGYVSQVWRNTGSGFTNINAGLPGVRQGSVAWGDYDNDGRLDILLTGDTGSGYVSQVWRNTSSGFVNINAGLPGVYLSSVAWGDYDNDGRLDILLTGTTNGAPSGAISQVWRNTGSGFVNRNAGLPGLYYGSVAWGDYDNDGRLDILLTGDSVSGGSISQVWRNTASGFVNANVGLPGIGLSSVAWGDYDNDGRLDILLTGATGSGLISQVWRNQQPVSNTVSAAPTGLAAAASGTVVTLSWNAANDAQTPAAGLTHNLSVGSTPGASDILSPMAAGDGYRRLPQMGNAQHNLSATLPVQLGKTYYWRVQAVDSAFAGSPFSGEKSFTLNTVLTPTNGVPVLGDRDGDGVVSQSELDIVLANYWPNSPWLLITNTAGLGSTNVQFALPYPTAWNFTVQVSTNFSDWTPLGPAYPIYQFGDFAASNAAVRFYRLRFP